MILTTSSVTLATSVIYTSLFTYFFMLIVQLYQSVIILLAVIVSMCDVLFAEPQRNKYIFRMVCNFSTAIIDA